MPFTLSHPAAVLPIWFGARKRLPLAPLLIGAASPDFEFFLHLNTQWTYSHTALGLIVVCLPASLLALWLFNQWGRQGAAWLLPAEWTFPPTPPHPYSLLSVICILCGAVTHLIWDAFTHGYGAAVQYFTALQTTAFQWGGQAIAWFSVLQHGGSLLGLFCLFLVAASWALRQPAPQWRRPVVRVVSFGVYLAIAGIANGARVASTPGEVEPMKAFFVSGGVAVTLAFGVGLVLLGMYAQYHGARHVTRSPASYEEHR